jgi:hypothetical protein
VEEQSGGRAETAAIHAFYINALSLPGPSASFLLRAWCCSIQTSAGAYPHIKLVNCGGARCELGGCGGGRQSRESDPADAGEPVREEVSATSPEIRCTNLPGGGFLRAVSCVLAQGEITTEGRLLLQLTMVSCLCLLLSCHTRTAYWISCCTKSIYAVDCA